MTIRVELNPETEARLKAEARAKGLPVKTVAVDRNGYGLSPQETDRLARTFEEKLRLLPDSLAVYEEWRKLLVMHSVSGVQVHDARLVASMRVHPRGRPLRERFCH